MKFFSLSLAATLNKMTKTIAAAKESDVHVVSADVLENVKTEGIIAQIKNRAISDWGSDVSKQDSVSHFLCCNENDE